MCEVTVALSSQQRSTASRMDVAVASLQRTQSVLLTGALPNDIDRSSRPFLPQRCLDPGGHPDIPSSGASSMSGGARRRRRSSGRRRSLSTSSSGERWSYASGCSADARGPLPSEQGSADTILTSERSVEAKESGNLEDLARSDSYAKAVEAEDSGNLEVLVRSDSYAEAERDAAIRHGSAAGGRDEGSVGCPQSVPSAAVSLLKQEPRQRPVSLLARNSCGFLPAVAQETPQRVSFWLAADVARSSSI
eukprot:gene14273-biopygen12156